MFNDGPVRGTDQRASTDSSYVGKKGTDKSSSQDTIRTKRIYAGAGGGIFRKKTVREGYGYGENAKRNNPYLYRNLS